MTELCCSSLVKTHCCTNVHGTFVVWECKRSSLVGKNSNGLTIRTFVNNVHQHTKECTIIGLANNDWWERQILSLKQTGSFIGCGRKELLCADLNRKYTVLWKLNFNRAVKHNFVQEKMLGFVFSLLWRGIKVKCAGIPGVVPMLLEIQCSKDTMKANFAGTGKIFYHSNWYNWKKKYYYELSAVSLTWWC